MMIRALILVFALLPVFAMTGAEVRANDGAREIVWADLLPEGESERLARLQQMQAIELGFEHFGAEQLPQIMSFAAVEELDGQRVRLGGYILPFDYFSGGRVTRFLLVPYVGACIHVPPPPPNQLVYVETSEPVEVEGLWDPIYAEGVIRIQRQDTDLAAVAYTLELESITPYRP
ncbi:MAG: DUF3299 domain-containing protein [Caulobacterales bacterium]|uniref:DUF3299 domain-containing protein n=1 Tax=Glycocaulis sp. TaxID=1969725 RepID=UPI003FA106AC